MVDFNIKIVTKGEYLSTNSFLWIVSDIRKVFEESIVEALLEDYDEFDENKLKKLTKGKIDFYISDFEKGSFIFVLVGALGGVLGIIFTDLAKDIIKENDIYKVLKEKINSPSKKIAQKFKNKAGVKKGIGPYAVEKHKIKIENKEKGVTIEYEITLKKPNSSNPPIDSEEQIKDFIKSNKNLIDPDNENTSSD